MDIDREAFWVPGLTQPAGLWTDAPDCALTIRCLGHGRVSALRPVLAVIRRGLCSALPVWDGSAIP